jgi:hypothetical protein
MFRTAVTPEQSGHLPSDRRTEGAHSAAASSRPAVTRDVLVLARQTERTKADLEPTAQAGRQEVIRTAVNRMVARKVAQPLAEVRPDAGSFCCGVRHE